MHGVRSACIVGWTELWPSSHWRRKGEKSALGVKGHVEFLTSNDSERMRMLLRIESQVAGANGVARMRSEPLWCGHLIMYWKLIDFGIRYSISRIMPFSRVGCLNSIPKACNTYSQWLNRVLRAQSVSSVDYRYQILPPYAKPGRLGCITVFTIAMSTVDGVDYRYQIVPLVRRVIGHDSAPRDMLRPR